MPQKQLSAYGLKQQIGDGNKNKTYVLTISSKYQFYTLTLSHH